MTHFALYDPASGRIATVVSLPNRHTEEAMRRLAAAHEQKAIPCSPDTSSTLHWVEDGLIAERPAAPRNLDALPCPCRVEVYSHALETTETYEVTDGCFRYADLPGTYTITVRAFPWKDAEFTVDLEGAQ
ncbi:hypothetical protein AZL_b05430 (plasmid) [Azospirillum sp. B510]|nr:hypothetical protein AZL_b05430 [Azospirillum sp. B510]